MLLDPVSDRRPEITISVYWSPRWKRYDIQVSGPTADGLRRWVLTRKMESDTRPEIDKEGARLLVDALIAEYEQWIF